MILTDGQIREAVKSGEICIEPFEERLVQPASYDFRVGRQGATTSKKVITDIEKEGYLLLEPGDFTVITVFERVKLSPQHVARFGLRSKYAREGLIATTGPQIDPGFEGRLILGLTNLTPKQIILAFKEELVTLEFHRLEKPTDNPYKGPYQGVDELRPEDIAMIVQGEGMALSEVLAVLSSLNKTVGALGGDVKDLTKDISNLKWVIPIIITIGIAVMGIIVGLG